MTSLVNRKKSLKVAKLTHKEYYRKITNEAQQSLQPTEARRGLILKSIGFLVAVILVCIALLPSQKVSILNLDSIGKATISPLPKKEVYVIVLAGDSMTSVLGTHGGKLSETLNTLYGSTPGNQRIVIANYSQSSTNILQFIKNMDQQIITGDITFEPLHSKDFDLILIESFGYNPLSQFGREEGLKKHTQALDHLIKSLKETHPHVGIVFVATIAPNKEIYAQESQDTSPAEREQQAEERIAYIENHIAYAEKHKIPLIDIYHKSLTSTGDGNSAYINSQDDIHPSEEGVDFINKEIATFMYESQILPK